MDNRKYHININNSLNCKFSKILYNVHVIFNIHYCLKVPVHVSFPWFHKVPFCFLWWLMRDGAFCFKINSIYWWTLSFCWEFLSYSTHQTFISVTIKLRENPISLLSQKVTGINKQQLSGEEVTIINNIALLYMLKIPFHLEMKSAIKLIKILLAFFPIEWIHCDNFGKPPCVNYWIQKHINSVSGTLES